MVGSVEEILKHLRTFSCLSLDEEDKIIQVDIYSRGCALLLATWESLPVVFLRGKWNSRIFRVLVLDLCL